MLSPVPVVRLSLDAYEESAGADAVASVREAARALEDARVLHINATSYGGGVAEILRSEVPMLRAAGVDAHWCTLEGDDRFFGATKALHNALQGADEGLTDEQRDVYLGRFASDGALPEGFDVIVVHDPQPLLLRELGDAGARWVWRCHVDTSEPHPGAWDLLAEPLGRYDAAVFTLEAFVPADVPVARVEVIAPAIDPEAPKNMSLDERQCDRLLRWIGVDVDRPLVTQVSRFDRWKNPLGVIEAWQLIRRDHPDVQLALVGSLAKDDPEGEEVHERIACESERHDDLLVFTDRNDVEINAFQRASDVVVQNSCREGFGLVVAEALWKGTPVVGGRAGGIPLQLPEEALVSSPEECASAVAGLLADRDAARAQGHRGHELVHDRYLMTRLVAEDLALWGSLLDGR